MKFNFWKKEAADNPAKTNQELAIDLLVQIKHKAPASQKEIVTMLFSQVFDDAHIHQNPRRRTA
jgi:hypothetical protein